MVLARLKAKNQLTIPARILKQLHVGPDHIFAVAIDGDSLRLTPVEIKPKSPYTAHELKAIDTLTERESGSAESYAAGDDFERFIAGI